MQIHNLKEIPVLISYTVSKLEVVIVKQGNMLMSTNVRNSQKISVTVCCRVSFCKSKMFVIVTIFVK